MSAAAANLLPNRLGDLMTAMQRGATVLTPNVRSARTLTRLYDAERRAEGLTAWQPARVFSWSGWTSSLWNEAILLGHVQSVLLNSLQEQSLWMRILEASGDLGLQSARSVARQCSRAMRLLGSSDLEDTFARTPASAVSDAAAFHGWYRDFLSACQSEQLLPSSHLDAELSSLFRRNTSITEKEYILYGFDALLPSQRSLLSALEHASATIEHLPADMPQQTSPTLVRCDDPHAEIDACCQWVRDTLATNPTARIAIVVPDLQECRSVLERTLRVTVAPWLEDVTQPHSSSPYEFSTGRPLPQLPMVADALLLLRWCASAVSVEDAGAILRSPFISLAPSPERGAELEAWTLRNTRKFRSATGLSGTITLRESQRLLHKEDPHTSSHVEELAKAAAPWTQSTHSFASFSDGARKLLETAGWPGNDLDSNEFQAQQRWNEVLDRVATLDLLGGHTTFAEWLETLTATLHETIFAPENTGAPIQVMTPSEAAGNTSDFLWFLHADEQTWPQHTSSSPLLPARFQRALRMPGSDTLVDEESAQQITLRCFNSAATACFSYAAARSEGESRPSPLVSALPGVQRENAFVSSTPTAIPLEDHVDPLSLPDLSGIASGGVGILTEQAQCGFRAFALHRLQTREMESIEAGLSAGERGDEVHTALQLFWDNCKTHEQLSTLNKTRYDDGTTARDTLLAECIAQALPARPAAGWDSAYIEVQRKRLHRLLSDWLDFESLRKPFWVEGMEVEVDEAHIGPLAMNLRVDRIDRIPLADGSEATLLIDYKTGSAERKDWFGDRPDAPQLPLYAIASGIPDVQGIAFGRVRVGRLGMNFEEMLADRALLGDQASKGRRTEPTFAERMEEWQHDLTTLAEAFARSEAVVEPKDYLITCKRCPSRLLCRVDVTRLEPDDDTLEETEEEGAV
ncbi:PD-(D/E)XK nuclease family protein [Terriglobus sp. TAA 43]|uniref:PD-(D/E)XK nuclease family protein n=1 Tax=Terriglobus sp. TAA 43 TaxID=278961 RepID=UPI0006485AC1|nr:PD-(D/E)XK nuclease family protein [Terriglobus sp. TAA 43]